MKKPVKICFLLILLNKINHTIYINLFSFIDSSKAEAVRSDILKPNVSIKKPKKQRPNYFVAIKISDAQVKLKIVILH